MNKIKYGIDCVKNFIVGDFLTGTHGLDCPECGIKYIGDEKSKLCLQCALDKLNKEKK